MNDLKDNQLCEILSLIPENTSCTKIIYNFIWMVLEKNNFNRSKTSKELKIPIRTLRNKLHEMSVYGFEIPPGIIGTPVRN